MSGTQRCVNLKDWQSRALLAGASVLVVPVRVSSWLKPCGTFQMKPLFVPGDILVGREGWCWAGEPGDLDAGAFYRASWGEHDYGPRWRSPQTMPAALARHRKLVVSVEPMFLPEISEGTARLTGCGAYVMGHGPVSEGELSVEPGHRTGRIYRNGLEYRWCEDHGKRHPWETSWAWVIGLEVEP